MHNAADAYPCDFNIELVAFLADTGGARLRLAATISRCILKNVNGLTRGWSAHDREEVVQQAFVALLENPTRFDPARGSAAAYLAQVTREAARTVRGSYAAVGNPKRTRCRKMAVNLPIEVMTERDHHDFARARYGSVAAIEARCDVQTLAERAQPAIALAFSRIGDGESKIATAAELGIDRFALDRQMARFRREMRLAA